MAIFDLPVDGFPRNTRCNLLERTPDLRRNRAVEIRAHRLFVPAPRRIDIGGAENGDYDRGYRQSAKYRKADFNIFDERRHGLISPGSDVDGHP